MAATLGQNWEPKYIAHNTEYSNLEDGPQIAAKRKAWELQFPPIHYPSDHLGRSFPEDLFPRQVILTKGKKLFDYNYIQGGLAVSQTFKDAVELIEPGVHQFFPVEILLKDGTLYKDPIYFLNIATRVDSINPELGGFNKGFSSKTPDRFYWSAASGKAEFLAVYQNRIAGRALWKDNRFGGIYDFASDALLEQLRKTAPHGWDIRHYFQEI